MLVQGSLLRSWLHRKMTGTTEGVILDHRQKCLLVPPNFTIGKNKIEKDESFRFITEDRVVLDEGVINVEWHPDLLRKCYSFSGTNVIGYEQGIAPLIGTLTAKTEFKIKDLPWLARLWVHN